MLYMDKIKKLKQLRTEVINFGDTLNLPDDITFGIEVEIENVLLKKINNIVEELKEMDPSFEGYTCQLELSNMSFFNRKIINGEISTSILRDCKKDWQNFNIVLNKLKEENAIITNKCASHINIGAHILGNNQIFWKNFLLLWKLYEEEIYQFSTGEYNKIRGLYYIHPLATNIPIDIKINASSDPIEFFKNFPICLRGGYNRCHNSFSLKKCNDYDFKKNNVIEFRTPNGTLDLNIYKNYVNFFVKFLLASKRELDIEKIIYKINNKDHDAFDLAELVFDNELEKNNFLIQTYSTNKIYKKRLKNHIYSR